MIIPISKKKMAEAQRSRVVHGRLEESLQAWTRTRLPALDPKGFQCPLLPPAEDPLWRLPSCRRPGLQAPSSLGIGVLMLSRDHGGPESIVSDPLTGLGGKFSASPPALLAVHCL